MIVDPFDAYSPAELFDLELTLHLACGRSKAVVKGKHRGRLCSLIALVAAAQDRKGGTHPTPPFRA